MYHYTGVLKELFSLDKIGQTPAFDATRMSARAFKITVNNNVMLCSPTIKYRASDASYSYDLRDVCQQ